MILQAQAMSCLAFGVAGSAYLGPSAFSVWVAQQVPPFFIIIVSAVFVGAVIEHITAKKEMQNG